MANDGTIWSRAEFKPFKGQFEKKQEKIATRRTYYDGRQYRAVRSQLKWLKYRVGKEIRPLFLPLARAVDVDAGIVPGGWLFPDELESPTPQVQGWMEARDQVFAWSHWQTKGVLFVHYGAQSGVAALKVSDLREEKRVTVTPVDPINLLLIGPQPGQDEPDMSIWVEDRIDDAGDEYEYAEVATSGSIRFFRNGDPFAPEGWEEENPNLQERVPYVEVRHIENGEPLGESTFDKAMALLDELNNLATDLATAVEKHGSKPQWAISGAEPSDLTHSDDVLWYLPEGAKVDVVIPEIDFQGVLAFIQEIKEGVKEALPELSFDELRSKDQIAAETLGLQLIELVLKVQRTRPNYDDGLARALRMAGEAAESMEGVTEIAALADPELEFDDERPVLPVDERTRLELEMMRMALEQEKIMMSVGNERPALDEGEDDERASA